MSNFFNLSLCLLCLAACTSETSQHQETKAPPEPSMDTITPKVTGIGGIFFKSKNPDEMKAWYRDNLGMSVDDFGAPFAFRNANRPDELNYLNWDAFVDTTSYFNPSEKPFMVNYRVQNIEGMVEKLKANGIVPLDEIVTVEYGKFIHLMDPEGNKIELWEPVDSVLTSFGRVPNQ